MDHLIVYDTESASLKAEDGLVEHAFVEIDDDMNILREVRSLIKPPGAISPGASGVHGITADDVKDAPSIEEFWDSIGNEFQNKKVLMVAFNAPFDAKFLAPWVGELDTLCALRLARVAFPKDTEGQPEGYVPPPDHKLPTMIHYLGLQRRGTHNALDDVYSCLGVVQKVSEKLGMNLEELYYLQKQPIKVKVMPFGKHKGEKLGDLPKQYVQWVLGPKGPENLDPDLRRALEAL